MKHYLLIIICLINFLGLSQNFEINLSFDPISSRLGNLKNQFVLTENNNNQLSSNIFHSSEINFYSVFGKQISINALLKKKDIFYGLDLTYFQHQYRFDVEYGLFVVQRNIKINNLGLSLLIGKKLKFNSRLLIGLEFTFPYSLKSNINVLVNNENQYTISEEKLYNTNNSFFAPKIIGNTYLTKRLSMNYGLKLKFWGANSIFYSFNLKDNNNTYLDFRINTKQLHFFLGFGFTIIKNNDKK